MGQDEGINLVVGPVKESDPDVGRQLFQTRSSDVCVPKPEFDCGKSVPFPVSFLQLNCLDALKKMGSRMQYVEECCDTSYDTPLKEPGWSAQISIKLMSEFTDLKKRCKYEDFCAP